eukprot:10138591-Ditylum_brightwellii.AAC.1
MGVTSRDIIDHLLDQYSKITPSDLLGNSKRFQEGVDISQPIDAYFTCIDGYIQYATDGKTPFATEQILTVITFAMQKTELFRESLHVWKAEEEASKTWEKLNTFLADDSCILKEEGHLATMEAGFHQANIMQDVLVALDNLANATMEERNIM